MDKNKDELFKLLTNKVTTVTTCMMCTTISSVEASNNCNLFKSYSNNNKNKNSNSDSDSDSDSVNDSDSKSNSNNKSKYGWIII